MADINKTWQTAFQPLRTERARLDRHSTARARAVNERRAAPAPRAGAARTAAMSAGWPRRPMSAVARKAVSPRIKPYWAARRKAPLANDPTRRPPHGPMGRCATSPPPARPRRLQPDRRCQRGPSQVRWRTVSSPTVRCDSGRDAVVTGLPATRGSLWSGLLGLES